MDILKNHKRKQKTPTEQDKANTRKQRRPNAPKRNTTPQNHARSHLSHDQPTSIAKPSPCRDAAQHHTVHRGSEHITSNDQIHLDKGMSKKMPVTILAG